MKRLLLALLLACAPTFAQCPSGFIQVTDTLYNPDGSLFVGTIGYTLAYNTTTAGQTIRGNRINASVVSGYFSACLAPGNYTALFSPGYSGFRLTVYWTVPTSGGPYTVPQIETSTVPTPSLSIAPAQINPGSNGQFLITQNGVAVWGAGGVGTGTVTSVGLSLPNIFSVAGSPVTTAGTLTGTLATQSANLVFAGPTTGSAAAPTFRALVAADLPTISLGGDLSGNTGSATVARLNGGSIPISASCVGTNGSGQLISASCGSTPSGAANLVYATPNGSSGNASLRALVVADLPTGYAYSNLSGAPTIYYQTVQANTANQTQRANLNFSTNFSLADSAANNRSTVDLAGTISANTSGNAATATALAVTPSQCSSGQYSTGVAASGNANCAQVAYGQLSGTPTLYYQTVQHDGAAVTQRSKFNLAAGSNVTIAASDNGTDTTTFTVAASGGGSPTGSAGGDLSGTYPNPSVAKVNGTSVPTNAAADQALVTSASATGAWTSIPSCLDSGGNHLNYNTSTHTFNCGTTGGTVGSVGFNGITTGTNSSATMTVDTGATITYSGSGVINANKISGSTPAASATTDTTNAANIGSGTLASARLTGSNGSAYQPLMAGGSGTQSWGVPSATSTATLGTIVDGDCAQVTPFTLSGASVGDVVFAGVSVALPSGVNAIAKVTASNTVSVEVCNNSEASYNVPSATYKVAILR